VGVLRLKFGVTGWTTVWNQESGEEHNRRSQEMRLPSWFTVQCVAIDVGRVIRIGLGYTPQISVGMGPQHLKMRYDDLATCGTTKAAPRS
jgi:hypothetical protein